MKKHILIAACAALLASCALFQNPLFDAALQAGIDAGFAACGPCHNSVDATLIATEATALQQIAQNNSAPIASLEAQANALVAASNLPVGDKAAFTSLIALVAGPGGLLVEGQQAIPATAAVPLALFFGDVATAASLYAKAETRAKALHVGVIYVPRVGFEPAVVHGRVGMVDGVVITPAIVDSQGNPILISH